MKRASAQSAAGTVSSLCSPSARPINGLYILTPDENSARRLAEFGERWLADSVIIHDEEETDQVLGGSYRGQWLVTMWWD